MSDDEFAEFFAELDDVLSGEDPKDEIITNLETKNRSLILQLEQKDEQIKYMDTRFKTKFGPVLGSVLSPEERLGLLDRIKRLKKENKTLRIENGKLNLDRAKMIILEREIGYVKRSFKSLSRDKRKIVVDNANKLKKMAEMKESLNSKIDVVEQEVKIEKEINKTLRLQLEVERDFVPPAKRSCVAIRKEGGGPACVVFRNGEPQTGVWEGGGFVQTAVL